MDRTKRNSNIINEIQKMLIKDPKRVRNKVDFVQFIEETNSVVEYVGLNSIVLSSTIGDSVYTTKICYAGKEDFEKEVEAMTILGPENISPKIYDSYWYEGQLIKLIDIMSYDKIEMDNYRNKNKEFFDRFHDKIKESNGFGVIIMENIPNIQGMYSNNLPRALKQIVKNKLVRAYTMGFISTEPDTVAFLKTPDSEVLDVRILDWGNAPPTVNESELLATLEYLKID